MSAGMIVVFTAMILALLGLLALETAREFGRMERSPDDFSGSDRLAGTGE